MSPTAGKASADDGSPSVAFALRRGQTLKDLGDLSEALLVHERALAEADGERTPFETGRLIHRVGGCALVLGDGPQAFGSYLDAGRRALEIGLGRHRGGR